MAQPRQKPGERFEGRGDYQDREQDPGRRRQPHGQQDGGRGGHRGADALREALRRTRNQPGLRPAAASGP